jgi:NADH:ubiquinone oxidoreductase subunit C
VFLKKYQFPLNIFIVFEKVNPIVYTSNVLTNNHYVCFIPKQWNYGINVFLKKEIFYNYSFLVEMSAIDTLKYNNILPNNNFLNLNNRFLSFNIYYFYFLKLKLTFVQLSNQKLNSIDGLYKNANWLEREVSEMYGINYLNKSDNRSLLLDYSRNEFPMLKDYPVEGFYEIYYDFFENKLSYIKNEFIEL